MTASSAARQLELSLDPAPRDAQELLSRLRSLGLRDVERLRLHSNRTVMVSFRDRELRVHRAYLDAPRELHEAIVHLVQGRTRAARAQARRTILAYPVPLDLRRPRRAPGARPLSDRDARVVAKLTEHHAALNAKHFGSRLSPVAIRLSDRMRSRLGHYAPATPSDPAHIALSRRHLRRDGWQAAVATLLHEMIHQWQSENGLRLDHRAGFRRMSRQVHLPFPAEAEAEAETGNSPLHSILGSG